MSDAVKQMTPEEKLLALIQQDKRQSPAAPASAATVADSPPAAPTPVPAPSAPARTPAPAPVASAAPVSAQPRQAPAPAPVVQAAEPSPPAAPVKEAAPRLKLAEPKLPLVVPEPAAAEPPPAVLPAAAAPVFVSLSPSRSAGLVLLNRVLGAVALVLILWVVYSIGAINPGITEAVENQIAGAGSLSMAPTAVPQGAPPALDSYLEKVTARNVFVSKGQSGAAEAGARPEVAGSPKDLKLVAVSMDSSSAEESMAIIRNKADSKTYFVKVGQTVGPTDYVLDRIFSDHVVVKLQKQLFDVK